MRNKLTMMITAPYQRCRLSIIWAAGLFRRPKPFRFRARRLFLGRIAVIIQLANHQSLCAASDNMNRHISV